MIETQIVDTWLYTVLSGDETLDGLATGVYADVAPPGATFPYIVYSLQANHDVLWIGGTKVLLNSALYQVKAVDQSESYTTLATIASQIETLLTGQRGSTEDGQVLSVARQEIVRYAEVTDGVQYRHLGGLYRIEAQSDS